MKKQLVLVVASTISPGKPSVTGAGIKVIKRGETLESFTQHYLESVNADDAELIIREKQILAKFSRDDAVFHWVFTLYEDSQLFEAVGNLTREELLRDMKDILPLVGKK